MILEVLRLLLAVLRCQSGKLGVIFGADRRGVVLRPPVEDGDGSGVGQIIGFGGEPRLSAGSREGCYWPDCLAGASHRY